MDEFKTQEKNLVDNVIAYENGEMEEEGVIKFFQHLINTERAWTLQGHYGRMASSLIEAGLCTMKKT